MGGAKKFVNGNTAAIAKAVFFTFSTKISTAQNTIANDAISGCTAAANRIHKPARAYFFSRTLVTANTAANAARFRGFKYWSIR